MWCTTECWNCSDKSCKHYIEWREAKPMTKIKCTHCGDILEGDKRGTWKTCSCRRIYIDETKYYCRIGGDMGDFEIINEGNGDDNGRKSEKELQTMDKTSN